MALREKVALDALEDACEWIEISWVNILYYLFKVYDFTCFCLKNVWHLTCGPIVTQRWRSGSK
jgi:hypothetical protein